MIKIICHGKIKEKYLNELIEDYKKRISKYHKIEIIELKDYDNLEIEKSYIEKHISNQDYVIALDIDGKHYESTTMATLINDTFNHYGTITMSFSKLTFPHGLFRGILLEQIYRSFKILNNESYHK